MANLGINIELYLMDGTASGRWQAALSNWNCSGYKIPRAELKNCEDLIDLHTPGVYFLFGRDNESAQPFVYIGEGDDALKRILQPHNFEKDGSYWTEAIILVTPDGSLDKAKIKYLENRFHHIAVDVNRYIVKNSNTPTKSPVNKKIQDMLEEFILNARLIMPAMGHKVFEPQPSETNETAEESILFIFRNKGKSILAKGKLADDGFWVLKGSQLNPELAKTTPPGVVKARQQYASQIDQKHILQKDVSFGSPSYASSFVLGRNTNGLMEWKNKNGVSLKETSSEEGPKKENQSGKVKNHQKETPQISAPNMDGVLHLSSKKLKASAYISGETITVLKGSQVSQSVRKSCRKWIVDKREELIKDGTIANGIFTIDTAFSSPSAAAAVILGGESNGQSIWKNDEGKTLKELKSKE